MKKKKTVKKKIQTKKTEVKEINEKEAFEALLNLAANSDKDGKPRKK